MLLDTSQKQSARSSLGPIMVGLAAALWGTETLWRVFLNKQFPSDVLVFYEHLYCLLFSLPILFVFRSHLKGIPKRAWLFLLGSGVFGSAVGTFFFTLALTTLNLSMVNIMLNIQPLFSAVFARLLLGEQFGKGFFKWAFVAILAGAVLSLDKFSLKGLVISWAIWPVLVTALCWSFATVAGRGTNQAMSYRVSSPLRFVIGLVAIGAIVLINHHTTAKDFNWPAFSQWQTHQDFLYLSIFAGVIPLFLYFKGLTSTQASVAAFFEMFQIVAALIVTWGFFHQTLALHQIIAALVLLVAAYQISRIQA